MKVAFISRTTLYSGPGGDTVQMERTAAELRKLGVEVNIRLANERFNYGDYDLLHLFNVIRPADLLRHARASTVPYMLSTILVDYSEYDRSYRGPLTRTAIRVLGKDAIEFGKAGARWLRNGEALQSPSYLLRGHRKSIRYLAERAACLLPNSHSEYQRLFRDYGIEKPYRVIPNAIDPALFHATDAPPASGREGVLCVGRIEGYKNQLNLIRAVRDTPFALTVVGRAAPNHQHYARQCRAEAGNNVAFIEHLPQKELAALYRSHRVHALPSWFETTGLSSLEAAASGCQLVITNRGDQREYFRDDVHYCEPGDPASIRAAIEQAWHAPDSSALRDRVNSTCTW
ncbi:MAG: glycosyltransferase family 4 protein, partial [Bacteroidota bacterium]